MLGKRLLKDDFCSMSISHPTLVPKEGALGALCANIAFLIKQELEIKQIPAGVVSVYHDCKPLYIEGACPLTGLRTAQLFELFSVPTFVRPIPPCLTPCAPELLLFQRAAHPNTGFGYQDKAKTIPVTENTVFRMGSITKLFTTMTLVLASDEGKISLDEPIETYIPEFQIKNPFKTPVTARHLMTHTAGLPREPPRGHYMDDDPAITVRDTVLSMNGLELFFEPGTQQKYSNGAIAVVGYLLEVLYQKPWEAVIRDLLLDPLGMSLSDLEISDRVAPHLAEGVMYSQDNRLDRDAPLFKLGEGPAGTLNSTAIDMQKFANMVLSGGKLPDGKQLFKQETLDMIFSPQFPDIDRKGVAFVAAIGWQSMDVNGVQTIGHGGAIYGHSSRFGLIRAKRISVVLSTCGDCAVSTVVPVGNYIYEQFNRYVEGATSFPLRVFTQAPLEVIKKIEGCFFETGEGSPYEGYGETKHRRVYHFDNRFGKLMARNDIGYAPMMLINTYDVSDPKFEVPHSQKPHEDGTYRFEVLDRFTPMLPLTFHADFNKFEIKDGTYERVITGEDHPFEPKPSDFRELSVLCGEYGPDHSPTYIIERYGRLLAVVEWLMTYPLRPAGEERDAHGKLVKSTWLMPSSNCFYADEKVIFYDFNEYGQPKLVHCTGIEFERRLQHIRPEVTHKIDLVRTIAQVRDECLAAKPPAEITQAKRKPELVDMSSFKLEPPLKLDIRYATDYNFVGDVLYQSAKAFAQKPAAEEIVKAHKWLNKFGYGLIIFDIYRPWHVTKMLWEATPEHQHHFVANPQVGSIHNRGGAIDCGLYDLATGKEVFMVAGFDEMTPRSYRDYAGGTSLERWHARLLRTAMQMHRFEVYEYEWWHFNFEDQLEYPVMNESFEQLTIQQ